jgi:DNA polymerase/3'-5' exonuclease PolX
MKKLFEQAIQNIEELIKLRYNEISLLSQLERKKDASAIQFKLKNYKLWIGILQVYLSKCTEIQSKTDISNLKISSKSLENKLLELYETGYIKDLEDVKNDIVILEKEIATKNNDSLFNSVNSHTSNIEEEDIKLFNKHEKKKAEDNLKPKLGARLGCNNDENCIVKGIDTSKIESQPKILAEETRPTDLRGASIFDLRYVYGIGEKNAEKLFDMGITLEKLLEDWTNWIKKDENNANLMISKLPIPNKYTKTQWLEFSEDKQNNIQTDIINKKLSSETKYLHKLGEKQLLGIKYFHDMSQKILREEVQKAEKILKASASHMNNELIVTLCGSFRRGRDKSGDIDCLITHPFIKTMEDLESYPVNLLQKFVEFLTKLDFLVDHLTSNGRSKYMGFCIVKQSGKVKTVTARRIDIRFIPYDSYGTAILYFTGSKNFNTKMRSHALSKGYSLNEYGLKRLKDNLFIPCKTEEEVFQILTYPYKKPNERDI